MAVWFLRLINRNLVDEACSSVNAESGDIHLGGDVRRLLRRIEERLASIRDGGSAGGRQWLAVHDVAEELQISRDTVFRLITSGQLKAAELTTQSGHGFRRRYRVHREWLDAYMLGTVRDRSRSDRSRRGRRASKGGPRIDFIG